VVVVVGVGVWWWWKGGGSGRVDKRMGSQCASNLLQNLNIDLRVDTRGGYVPVDKVQKH
jgi:hypothetical protein